MRYVDTQNYFLIDCTESPVVEYRTGYQDGNIKRRGRVFYTKDSLVKDDFIRKNEKFQDMANDFFKWIRKHFKNVKMKGYEEILITERTLKWLNGSKDRKLADFPEVIKQEAAERKQLVA